MRHILFYISPKVKLLLLSFLILNRAYSATYTVTNNGNTGAGSLRQAITDANANAGTDNISFNIASTTVAGRTITPTTALPTITEAVIIDGTTQTSGNAFSVSNAKIIVDGTTSGGSGFTVTASGFEIYGIWVNNYPTYGIYLNGDATDNAIIGGSGKGNVISGNVTRGIYANGSDRLTIQGNIIGLDTSGTIAENDNDRGIYLENGTDTVLIGGTTAALRNYISGNDFTGVYIIGDADSVVFYGNYIGTSYNGLADVGNGDHGIWIDPSGSDIYIGGSGAGEGNVISGNSDNGIYIEGDYVTIKGNSIGLDATQTADIGNTLDGIRTESTASYVTVGGTSSGDGNIISGNSSDGIDNRGAYRTKVLGNIIGLDNSGTLDRGNAWRGVYNTGDSLILGDGTSGGRNIIAGNGNDAIYNSASQMVVQGNYIGTDITGTLDIGNVWRGIYNDGGDSILIGGNRNNGEGNIISNSVASDGITLITGSSYVTIQGNIIGLDVNGTTDRRNGIDGIKIEASVSYVTIGGNTNGEGNIISANCCNFSGSDGIHDEGSYRTIIRGNLIGTDITGTIDMGHPFRGIYALNGDSMIVENNLVSGNNRQGITINGGDDVVIKGNIIGLDSSGTTDLGNTREGIELLSGSYNTVIGGTTASERNVISGNDYSGIIITSDTVSILGNYIGVNTSASAVVANTQNGIRVDNGSDAVTIGGASAGSGNVIGGNTLAGILLYGSDIVTIKGNYIGTDVAGTTDLGNTTVGIHVQAVATDSSVAHIIGGTGAGEGNAIAYNGSYGVLMENSSTNTGYVQRVSVSGNSFYCNTSPGINLLESSNSASATANITTENGTTISGNGATAGALMELYGADNVCSNCEGKTLTATAVADGAGNWSFSGSFTGIFTVLSRTTNGSTASFSTCTASLLPIELLSFEGEMENAKVRLYWTTTAEMNNDYFTIERSADGIGFEPLVIVDGAGNSNVLLNYETYDEKPFNGLNYYRLRQTDFDGKNEAFNVVVVNFTNEVQFNLMPNPVEHGKQSYLQFEGFGENEEILIMVRNMLGEELYSKVLFTGGDGGVYEAVDPYGRLSPGTYIIIGSTADEVYSKRLIVR